MKSNIGQFLCGLVALALMVYLLASHYVTLESGSNCHQEASEATLRVMVEASTFTDSERDSRTRSHRDSRTRSHRDSRTRSHRDSGAKSTIKSDTSANNDPDTDSGNYVAVSVKDFCNAGRLGNKMFHVAAGIGVAFKNKATYTLVEDTKRCKWTSQIRELFSGLGSVSVIPKWKLSKWRSIKQEPYMSYTDYRISASTTISGFFQNIKYITDASIKIRSAFQLNNKYIQHANKTIQDIRRNFPKISSPQFVGVHIRLGDILDPKLIKHGYTATNATFYEHAMKIMADKHGRDQLIFVVSSDTISMAKEMLAPLTGRYHISYLNSGGDTVYKDFSVLYSMDHMITSGGTFGFWPAWRVAGSVVYFSEYARPGSKLSQLGYCQECFNFPSWIPVGNTIHSHIPEEQ